MTDHLALVAAIDGLYAAAVTDPSHLSEHVLADWAADIGDVGRAEARHVRRSLRIATKLRDFWLEHGGVGDADWRSRVDRAVGPAAWRPTLEIAMLGLDAEPSEELFDVVKRRFREVNSEWWMEGVSYADWLGNGGPSSG